VPGEDYVPGAGADHDEAIHRFLPCRDGMPNGSDGPSSMSVFRAFMPQSSTSSIIRRAAGALLFAVVLWGIVSLSNQFSYSFEVPLRVELPGNQALTEPVPAQVRVTTRASGWSLMKMLATERTECVVYPPPLMSADEQVVGIGRNRLLASIRTNIPDAQQVSIFPDSLTLAIGPVDSKDVPLSPEVTINTRRGFQVIGQFRLEPDTVRLVGSKRILEDITSWPTAPLLLDDIHNPVSQYVRLSDTLRGIITPQIKRAELYADVQEVAERIFPDIPLVNRGTVRDTSMRLVLQPQQVEVLVRGGVRDLSRLDPAMISAYVEIIEGVDTAGIAYPNIYLPPGYNVSVVTIKPERIRYLFRRTLEK